MLGSVFLYSNIMDYPGFSSSFYKFIPAFVHLILPLAMLKWAWASFL